ncbi:lachesin-like isoform X2 [Palaemon carinicauda]|uniref:lachesin-like isoform X2 n=1 Tax=Palaemon carinicauda TaxID=392227 RepID=UPI0035B5CD71
MKFQHILLMVGTFLCFQLMSTQGLVSSRSFLRDDDSITLDTSFFLRESPHFGLPMQTVTVNVGQTARLTCIIQDVVDYEVAWMNKDTNTVISLGETIITMDARISVQREQRSTWILTIKNVTVRDHGYYTCNINTQPPTSIQGYLKVVEPPVLEDGDEEVRVLEGMTAHLSCSAHAIPSPTYKWIREDYNTIRINSSTFVSSWIGRNLTLHHSNHRSAGGYLCIASNGYPPSVSKRVILHVYFAPLLRGPGMEVKTRVGQSVSLTCLYAAYPSPSVVWVREDENEVEPLSEEYYTITPQDGHPPYTHNMTLQLRKLVHSDFGRYTCVVTNSQGEASYTTVLREVVVKKVPITSTKSPPENVSLFPKHSSRETSHLSHHYHNYDYQTKNLSSPLIVNMKTGEGGIHPAPSRDQSYSTRRSKNIARISLKDVNNELGGAETRIPMKLMLLVLSIMIFLT